MARLKQGKLLMGLKQGKLFTRLKQGKLLMGLKQGKLLKNKNKRRVAQDMKTPRDTLSRKWYPAGGETVQKPSRRKIQIETVSRNVAQGHLRSPVAVVLLRLCSGARSRWTYLVGAAVKVCSQVARALQPSRS